MTAISHTIGVFGLPLAFGPWQSDALRPFPGKIKRPRAYRSQPIYILWHPKGFGTDKFRSSTDGHNVSVITTLRERIN